MNDYLSFSFSTKHTHRSAARSRSSSSTSCSLGQDEAKQGVEQREAQNTGKEIMVRAITHASRTENRYVCMHMFGRGGCWAD